MADDLNGYGSESYPLKSLAEIFGWSVDTADPKLVGKPLSKSIKQKGPDEPKLLLCHDMAGGYLEDRFSDGCVVKCPYYITEWFYVDIFVYFSHCLVTVPPKGWIDAAHTHGVPVLGTFITEFENGAKICDEFLNDRNTIRKICSILSDICLFYQFDGWLLNIENKIKKENLPNLNFFVEILANQCKAKLGGQSLVIWYDSVTIHGDLKWQNELNSLNESYFMLCDGIFLNYTWKDKNLHNSVEHVLKLKRPKSEVYVGIDVFGRGCFGGGGFQCNLAFEMIAKYNFSLALFAPGWVYQNLAHENFEENSFKFWSLLSNFIRCNKIISIPFETNFDPGKSFLAQFNSQSKSCCKENRQICINYLNLSRQQGQLHWFCQNQVQNLQKLDSNSQKLDSGSQKSDSDSSKIDSNSNKIESEYDFKQNFYYIFNDKFDRGFSLAVKNTNGLNFYRLYCCDVIIKKSIKICIKFACDFDLPVFPTVFVGLLVTVVKSRDSDESKFEKFLFIPPDFSGKMPKNVTEKIPYKRILIDQEKKIFEITAEMPFFEGSTLKFIDLVIEGQNFLLYLLNFNVF